MLHNGSSRFAMPELTAEMKAYLATLPDFCEPLRPGVPHPFYGDDHITKTVDSHSSQHLPSKQLAKKSPLASELINGGQNESTAKKMMQPIPTAITAAAAVEVPKSALSPPAQQEPDDTPAVDLRSLSRAEWITALFAALGNRDDMQLTALLQAQAPRSASDLIQTTTHNTALHAACAMGHLRAVSILLNTCPAHILSIDAVNSEGETALLKACTLPPVSSSEGTDSFSIVKLLLMRGANPEHRDHDGWTALHNACSAGRLDIVKWLIDKARASINPRSFNVSITPLMNAISKGHVDIVRFLVSRGSVRELLLSRNQYGEVPADIAAANLHTHILAVLHEAEVTAFSRIKDREEKMAFEEDFRNARCTMMMEIYENQKEVSRLFGGNGFVASDGDPSSWTLIDGKTSRTRETVLLPSGNWFWLTDWQIDTSMFTGKTPAGVDTREGWWYSPGRFDAEPSAWTAIYPTFGITDRLVGTKAVRRRRWVRVAKRRVTPVQPRSAAQAQGQQPLQHPVSPRIDNSAIATTGAGLGLTLATVSVPMSMPVPDSQQASASATSSSSSSAAMPPQGIRRSHTLPVYAAIVAAASRSAATFDDSSSIVGSPRLQQQQQQQQSMQPEFILRAQRVLAGSTSIHSPSMSGAATPSFALPAVSPTTSGPTQLSGIARTRSHIIHSADGMGTSPRQTFSEDDLQEELRCVQKAIRILRSGLQLPAVNPSSSNSEENVPATPVSATMESPALGTDIEPSYLAAGFEMLASCEDRATKLRTDISRLRKHRISSLQHALDNYDPAFIPNSPLKDLSPALPSPALPLNLAAFSTTADGGAATSTTVEGGATEVSLFSGAASIASETGIDTDANSIATEIDDSDDDMDQRRSIRSMKRQTSAPPTSPQVQVSDSVSHSTHGSSSDVSDSDTSTTSSNDGSEDDDDDSSTDGDNEVSSTTAQRHAPPSNGTNLRVSVQPSSPRSSPVPIPAPLVSSATDPSLLQPHSQQQQHSASPRTPLSPFPHTLPMSEWEPDENASHCRGCGTRFTLFYRRHHCRRCGQVRCDNCTSRRFMMAIRNNTNDDDDDDTPIGALVNQLEQSTLSDGSRIPRSIHASMERVCNPCYESLSAMRVLGRFIAPAPTFTYSARLPQTQQQFFHQQQLLHQLHHAESAGSLQSSSNSTWQRDPARMRTRSGTDSRAIAHAPGGYQGPGDGANQLAINIYNQLFGGVFSAISNVPISSSSASAAASSSSGLLGTSLPNQSTMRISGHPVQRSASGSSIMNECPVCGIWLEMVSPDREEQERHVGECLENRSGTSAAIKASRLHYISSKLPDNSPSLGEECAICFEEFEAGTIVARLNCLCIFHKHCVDGWFARTRSCPVHQRLY